MDYIDAIDDVLERAGQIRLPRHKTDVVTEARREFRKNGACDSKFIDPIEQALRECLLRWTTEQKRSICESTETGMQSGKFEDYEPISIDRDLEGELMYDLIEELAGGNDAADADEDDRSF